MRKYKATKRSIQLLPLLEQYNVIGWMHRHSDIDMCREDIRWVLNRDKIDNELKELDMLSMAEDYEPLPEFCVMLHGGDMVTCYKKEVCYCECGRKLDECDDCGGLICLVCDEHGIIGEINE